MVDEQVQTGRLVSFPGYFARHAFRASFLASVAPVVVVLVILFAPWTEIPLSRELTLAIAWAIFGTSAISAALLGVASVVAGRRAGAIVVSVIGLLECWLFWSAIETWIEVQEFANRG